MILSVNGKARPRGLGVAPPRPSLAALTVALAVGAAGAGAQTTIQLTGVAPYGTFHAGGVVATVAGDSDLDGSAALEWRESGAGSYRPAHELIRIDATRFVGSLFRLRPGTDYDVRVTVSDPDGVVGPASMSAALATRAELAPAVPLRTLYVAPWGDDSNPGTDPGAPLRTIQEAANRSQPGDRVSIANGVYRESVDVPSSGTPSAPIVFRGSGAAAVLDGADAAIAQGVSWTAQGGGVFFRTLGFSTGHVVTELGRLFRYGSLAELQALEAGPPGGFWLDGSTLRVRFSDGSSPETHAMHVARRENGFVLDGVDHVRIENLEIRHYGSGDYGKGVYLRYADDCAVRGARIHEVGAAGVWIKGGARNLIEGNEIWDTSIPGWDWNWTKGSSSENNAVTLTDDVGRGNVIRRNVVHGTFNGIGPCGGSAPPSGFTTETDLYDNELFDHNDDAFEPEGWCSNVRLWENRVTDVHMAFAIAPAAPGPTWILRNVAWRFGSTRTSQTDGYIASALKINSGYPTPIGPVLLYHNTFATVAPDTPGLALLNPGESTWIRARNNVVASTSDPIYKVNPVALDLDFDDLHRSTAGRIARWEGVDYPDLPALRAGTGQELSGISAAPLFTDPFGGDFTPVAASPLVDAGVALPGINDLPAGQLPDIGAVERAILFADGFETGDTSRWTSTVGSRGPRGAWAYSEPSGPRPEEAPERRCPHAAIRSTERPGPRSRRAPVRRRLGRLGAAPGSRVPGQRVDDVRPG